MIGCLSFISYKFTKVLPQIRGYFTVCSSFPMVIQVRVTYVFFLYRNSISCMLNYDLFLNLISYSTALKNEPILRSFVMTLSQLTGCLRHMQRSGLHNGDDDSDHEDSHDATYKAAEQEVGTYRLLNSFVSLVFILNVIVYCLLTLRL